MNVSEEARAFIAERERWWLENPPPGELLTLDNAKRLRAEHKAESQADCDTAVVETGARTSQIELGGVKTLQLEVENRREAVVLYFFGGAFAMGSPEEDVTITAPLAAELGMPIYGPYYPLSPEERFPAALDTGVAVYRALLDRFHADRIAVVGESAGGNLAVAVALRALEQGLPSPGALVALSPWADLTMAGHSQEINVDPTMRIEDHWGPLALGYAGDTALTHPLVSPVHADYNASFPPTLVTTGTRDLLLSDCVRLTTKMRRAGAEVTIHIWEEMWHVFEANPDLPEARESIVEIARFIKRYVDQGD